MYSWWSHQISSLTRRQAGGGGLQVAAQRRSPQPQLAAQRASRRTLSACPTRWSSRPTSCRDRRWAGQLALGAARCFDAGRLRQTLVEMEEALLLIVVISDGSCL